MANRQMRKRDGSENQERLLSKDYILVMFSSACYSFMNQFILISMPLFISKLGGLTVHAGLAGMVFAVTALLARPVSGSLSDRVGRVKLLVSGALVCAVCCALLGVVSLIPVLFIIRAINGAAFGIQSTCAGAAVADVLPKSRLAEGIGYFGMYSIISQAAGPGIAMAIVAGDRMSDYRTLFFITAGICAAGMIAASCVTYERKRKKALEPAGARGTQDVQAAPTAQSIEKLPDVQVDDAPLPKTFFGFEYVVFAPVAALLMLYVAIAGLMSYLTPYAWWKGIGNPSLYYAVSAAGIFISRMIFGRVADKRGADIIIIPGIAVMIVCLAILPAARSLSALVMLALPLGLVQGAVIPTFNSMMFKRCSPARRGTASGAYFVAIDGGFAIGGPVLGAIADIKDFNYIYWAGALFAALSLIIYLFAASDRRYNKQIRIKT